MEEIEKLKNEICRNQNFEEMLLNIKKTNKNKKITNILRTLENNTEIDGVVKRKIYGEIYDYIYDINKSYEDKIKNVFILGIEETLKHLNEKDFNTNKNWKTKEKNRKMKRIQEIIKNIRADGITRKLDELGRLVIPSEYRKDKVEDGKTPVKIYNIKDYVVVELLDKANNNTKKFDELGRIVVQIEIRKKLNWNKDDKIKIWDCGKFFIMQKEKKECIFCGKRNNLIEYKKELLCKQCLEELKLL